MIGTLLFGAAAVYFLVAAYGTTGPSRFFLLCISFFYLIFANEYFEMTVERIARRITKRDRPL